MIRNYSEGHFQISFNLTSTRPQLGLNFSPKTRVGMQLSFNSVSTELQLSLNWASTEPQLGFNLTSTQSM
jgi:hypothetical protein